MCILTPHTYNIYIYNVYIYLYIYTHTYNTYIHTLSVLSVSRSLLPNSLWPHGLQLTRLLCPWDFPGNDTRVGCHFLLQEIFPTQGSNPGLLHYRQILHHWATREAPIDSNSIDFRLRLVLECRLLKKGSWKKSRVALLYSVWDCICLLFLLTATSTKAKRKADFRRINPWG